MNEYSGLEPSELWRHFAALNHIPRASGHEAQARAYVAQQAREAGLEFEIDKAGNIIVHVPARDLSNTAPVTAVQAHLDMVCEKRPEVEHDFLRDPITPQRRGDLIFASGTTLGADNGIGAAAALALMTTPDLCHGPLELVFTVEEETGLYGATGLDAANLRAQWLINLDSEDPEELTIGCAGGAGTSLALSLERQTTPTDCHAYEMSVTGLQGGHSGVQIHENLANAIKLLNKMLLELQQATTTLRLSSISGGSAHNAIPRDARAQFVISANDCNVLENAFSTARAHLQAEWQQAEPQLTIELQRIMAPSTIMALDVQSRLLHLLDVLPHGVQEMSEQFPGKVQTSTNLAHIATVEGEVEIATSSRSFLAPNLENLQQSIQELGTLAGAHIEVRDGYPGWAPRAESELLRVAQRAYQTVWGKSARVEVVHAGLECGVIVAQNPTLEAISFGPLIRGAHSPDEHVVASTVEPTWNLLIEVLTALAKQ